MQSDSLKDKLAGKYIICVCEGNAEEAIIELLLEHDLLCFKRDDLLQKSCTQIRAGDRLAEEYLRQEHERDVVILRIQDRGKERLKLPKSYKHRVYAIYNVITRPEIEILHVFANGLKDDFDREKRRQRQLQPSDYCQAQFSEWNVKSKEFIDYMYANDTNKLIRAIEQQYRFSQQTGYKLKDILAC